MHEILELGSIVLNTKFILSTIFMHSLKIIAEMRNLYFLRVLSVC